MRTIKVLLRIVLLVFCLGAFWYRSYLVNHIFGSITGCQNCFEWPTFSHDAVVLAVLLLLYCFSLFPKLAILQFIVRFCALFIFFIYVADIVVLKVFLVRLTITDVFKYIGEIKMLQYVFNNVFTLIEKIQIGVLTLISVVASGYFIVDKIENKKIIKYIVASIAIVLLIIAVVGKDIDYVHSWSYKNVFEVNYRNGNEISYSPKFKNDCLQKEKEVLIQECEAVKAKRINIIVICVESLSMYHSSFFSGLNNATPNIDRIAKESISFKNFYSNGFTTESGLIAYFTGDFPIPKVQKYFNKGFSYDGFYNSKDSLPRRLKEVGYKSEFLTAGYLKFGDKENWLNSLGFDYIEGSTHPYYYNWERFNFDAAPDEALYNRLKERIKSQDLGSPYFIFVETVSTHHPFINPESGLRSEIEAFKYADKQLGFFYDYLKTTEFFDNGMLIIVSDHRSMTPVRLNEVKKYGNRALARIPLIIVDGKDVGQIINMPFQQVDLYHSIIGLTSGVFCKSKFYGAMLGGKLASPQYIFYSRGDQRDVISVYNGHKSGDVKLKGDKTAVINGKIDNAQLVVDKINYERFK